MRKDAIAVTSIDTVIFRIIQSGVALFQGSILKLNLMNLALPFYKQGMECSCLHSNIILHFFC